MERDWVALADEIRAELARREWSQSDLARNAKIDPRTLRRIISGQRHGRVPPALARIEVALDWRPGSARRILEGGGSPEARTVNDAAAELAELLRRLEKLPPRYRHRAYMKILRDWLEFQEEEQLREHGE